MASDLEQTPNLDPDVRRSRAIDLFRRGKLTHHELSTALGLDRFETDAYLKRHNIFDGSLTSADVEADCRALNRFLRSAPR
jgi:hypothetical protein